MAEQRNPLLQMLPTQESVLAIAQIDPRAAFDMLEQVSLTFVELLETAHRDDHAQHEHGGDHERTSAVQSSIEMALVERYAEHPQLLARIYVHLMTTMALASTTEELHAAEGGTDA